MRLCVAILGLLFLAGCDKPNQPAPLRYQLVVASSEMPNFFTYLVDTQTGALWQRVQYTDLEDKPTVWVQQKFVEPLAPSSAQTPMSSEILRLLHPPIKKEEEKK